MEDTIKSKFDSWAVVELFGHTQLAGRVTTETIANVEFVRIDVPQTKSCPEFTKYHGPSAIYGITPVGEEYAKKMAEEINAKPINNYKHNQVMQQLLNEKLQKMQLSLTQGKNEIDF